MSILEVKNLTVSFPQTDSKERIEVLKDISFSLEKGEILGIVGESGSGKTMTALSIMRLLPERGKIDQGEIIFSGQNLLKLPERKMRKTRGKSISMIFQDPVSSLNPVVPVGEQIKEMFLNHFSISRAKAKKDARELIKRIGIPDPEKRYWTYPHELSGGMNQRIMIAMMALVTKPQILIADEPTTALDVTVQKRILDLLTSLVKELGISLILITHNFGLIAEYVDKVVVMKEGEIVEVGDVFEIFKSPSHPYTRELLKVIPKMNLKTESD